MPDKRIDFVSYHANLRCICSQFFFSLNAANTSFFAEMQVRKSMCRIKHVLTERAIDEPDPRRSAEMKRMINAL